MITLKISMLTTQDYYSLTLIVWCMKLTEDVFEDFSKHKEIFDFSNYSAESKCHNNSNKLVAGKMKDETGVTSKGLVGLKSKMYFFFGIW